MAAPEPEPIIVAAPEPEPVFTVGEPAQLILASSVGEVSSDAYDQAPAQDASSELILTSSVGDTTSDAYGQPADDVSHELQLTASVDTSEDAAAADGLIMVDSGFIESTPLIAPQVQEEIQPPSVVSEVQAQPFESSVAVEQFSAPVISQSPPPAAKAKLSPSPVKQPSPQPPPQIYSPQPPPEVVQQVQAPPPVSPKPSHTVEHATFDDGQTHREVTRETQVSSSKDGMSSTTIRRQTTSTSTTVKPAAYKAVQPSGPAQLSQSDNSSFHAPAPLSMSTPANFQHVQAPLPVSHSSDSVGQKPVPVFRPVKFVPGGSKKELPGLYPAGQQIAMSTSFSEEQENQAPMQQPLQPLTPMFQVKNIVGKPRSRKQNQGWQPNMWSADQKPSKPEPPVEDFASTGPAFPVPHLQQGISLLPPKKPQAQQYYGYDDDEDEEEDYQPEPPRGPKRPHVFAPPVEIHARQDVEYELYSPGDEPEDDEFYTYEEVEVADGPESPDSTLIRRKKNQYADSAFYDTPGHHYPTIDEQMKLCKKIGQSLTAAANKRSRGSKMFMKRKRKAGKWEHRGQGEWAYTGEVADGQGLHADFNDDGSRPPLFYFKIPNLKGRVGNDKPTKMALSKDQFEKLRLTAKKCEHRSVDPDTCFDIVNDLKASKGKGGRMFEKRKARSDKYVIDESNTRAFNPQVRLENVLTAPVAPELTPWQAAMVDGDVDAAFSHISVMERNQQLNEMMKSSAPRKLPITPLPPSVQSALNHPVVHTSLKGQGGSLLKGKNFNRSALGWGGGGEYPVAEKLTHIAPPVLRQFKTPGQQGGQQNGPMSPQYGDYNNKVKAFTSPGQSPYAQTPAQKAAPVSAYGPVPHKSDNWDYRNHSEWQAHDPETGSQQYGASTTSYRDMRHVEPPRPRSHHSEARSHTSAYRDEHEYKYVPVDNKFGSGDYQHQPMYMQPIIPGTDL